MHNVLMCGFLDLGSMLMLCLDVYLGLAFHLCACFPPKFRVSGFFSFPSVIPFHSRVQIQPKAIERIYNGVVLMFLYTDARGIMAYGMEL